MTLQAVVTRPAAVVVEVVGRDVATVVEQLVLSLAELDETVDATPVVAVELYKPKQSTEL